MNNRKVKILGTGKYLPSRIVTAEELDHTLGCKPGWVLKKSGVSKRHFITDETTAYMGAQAAIQAVNAAGLDLSDIDCIVCTSAVPQQPIPCTAVLMQKELGLERSGIPAFDVNATCLGFLAGLDLLSYMITGGRYRNVLLISSEIASIGLNWSQTESSILFGDGAAAMVLVPSEADESSAVLASRLETYSWGAEFSEIRGGGTALPATQFSEDERAAYLFDMQGEAIFKLVSRLLPDFMMRLLEPINGHMHQMKKVIPHQGSAMAMRLLQKKLRISDGQMMNIIGQHGNTISASIPMGIHEAVMRGEIERGDRFMLLGMAAGVSMGGMILDY